MAVCEQGYLCEVCGLDVAEITESDLYLRYVLGEVDPETLHVIPRRHIALQSERWRSSSWPKVRAGGGRRAVRQGAARPRRSSPRRRRG